MTNKFLFGTTALAAVLLSAGANAADDGLKLKIGGYAQAYVLLGNVDRNDGNDNFHDLSLETWNNEIWFTAEATAANGLTYGFRIELEGSSQGDQIDESYLYLSGGFGRIVLGADDGVGNSMAYQVPTATRSKTLKLEDQDYHPRLNANQNLLITAFDSPNHFSNDSQKIIYTTPRFAGFQFGASYAPDLSEDINTSGAGAATQGGFEPDNDANQANNAIELGVNYNQKFGDLGVQAAFTYYHDSPEVDSANIDDRQGFAVGGGISIKGFSVGVNYNYVENYRATSYTAAGREGIDLNQILAGVQYVTGPWSFGADFGWAKVDGDNAGLAGVDRGPNGKADDKLVAGMVGVGYNLAPGMEVDLGIQYYDWSSNVDAYEGDALVGLLGTSLTF